MQLSKREQVNQLKAQQNLILKQAKDSLDHECLADKRFQDLYYDLKTQPLLQEESQKLSAKLGSISATEMFNINNQVLAYKHLARNQTIPPETIVNSLSQNTWATEKQKLTSKALTFYKERIQKEPELRNMILGKFQNLRNRVEEEKYAREKVSQIIYARTKQLEQILNNSNNMTQEAKLRLEIQLKFLTVNELYYSSKDKILDSLATSNSRRILQVQLLDRAVFRPEGRQQGFQRNRNQNRSDNQLESQMKIDYERKKKSKHKMFIQQLFIHHGHFMEFHKKNIKALKKRANQVKTAYENIQLKKKRGADAKQLEQGLAILKEGKNGGNIEVTKVFIEHAERTKNKKILDILNQTNSFLEQLGAKVLVQKGEAPKQLDADGDGDKQQLPSLQQSFANANNTYYNLTHTILEQITTQPTMLAGGKLKHYQLVGLQWLVSLYNNNLNGILADQMGLGKTIQTISLFAYLMQHKKNFGCFLIIAPLSTISNWSDQFSKWAPSMRVLVYKGSQTQRNQLAQTFKTVNWNVCITTYEYILRDRKHLKTKNWKYIVIDQGHRMKNVRSKFSETLNEDYHSAHRLLLTGTPLQNNLSELWALLNFILPHIFNNCEDFEKWFSTSTVAKNSPESQHALLTQQERLLIINRLHQVLRPFLLRRIKKQVQSQLPDKIEHILKVQLSSWQQLLYTGISNKGIKKLNFGTNKVNNISVMNLMMQLRKCCNHPYLFLDHSDHIQQPDYIFRSSGKVELLDRILPKLLYFKHRILIFSQMTNLLDILEIYLSNAQHKYLRLDGSTSQQNREQITRQFNAPNSIYDILLLSTRAGGQGINLQTADTVIIYDSDWNPQVDKQAQDRAHRIGQQKQVLVLRFITDTPVEKLVFEKAQYKMNLDQVLIQGGMYNLKSSQEQRKQRIQNLLKKNQQKQTTDCDIPNDDTINQYLTRSSQEYQVFNQMDEQRYERQSKIYPNFIDPKKNQGYSFTYRLLGDDDIPDWLIQTQKPPEQEVKQFGRGARMRKKVNYNDGMNDDEFLQDTQKQTDGKLENGQTEGDQIKMDTEVYASQKEQQKLL